MLLLPVAFFPSHHIMEKEIRPGVFLSVITQEKWFNRTENLSREELTDFIMKCTPLRLANSEFFIDESISPQELLEACRDLEPDLNAQTDYYCLRKLPQKQEEV